MKQQAGLRAEPTEWALHALVRWGGDPFDIACLPAEGRIEIRNEPPDGEDAHARALCLAPVLPEGFVLAERDGDDTLVVVPPDAKASLHGRGPEALGLADGEAHPILPGEGVWIGVGAFEIQIQHVEAVPTPRRRAPVDWAWMRTGAVSGLVHGFTLAAAVMTPAPAELGVDLHSATPDWLQTRLRPAKETKPKPKALPEGLKKGPGPRMTDRAAPRRRRTRSDAEVAKGAGLLAVLGRADPATLAVLGGGDLSTGLLEATRVLRGPGTAGGTGLEGLGTRRGMVGGGPGSVHIGGLHTGGGGPGGGDIDLGGRGKRGTRVLPGRTILTEGLDKSAVRRVMRRNLARFKYCYEKEINAKPNLRGKVALRFTIAPNGQVAKVKIAESGLDDAAVEGCLTGVMKTLRFPQPKGGGVVVVTYPFVFAQT